MRHLLAVALVLVVCAPAVRAEDTPAAKKTKEKLQKKVTVKFKNDRLSDVVLDLKDMVKGLRISIDTKGGVSRNQRITYSGTDVTLADALTGMLKKASLTYTVTSQKGNAYDGFIKITRK
jgi:hypothetical protein